MSINKYIDKAKKQADKSKFSQYRIGCIIVKSKRIISTGYNRTSGKINRIAAKYNIPIWSLHAEMDALIKADQQAKGAMMFVSGYKTNGSAINCKPCEGCIKMAKNYGIKIIFFSMKNGIEYIELV